MTGCKPYTLTYDAQGNVTGNGTTNFIYDDAEQMRCAKCGTPEEIAEPISVRGQRKGEERPRNQPKTTSNDEFRPTLRFALDQAARHFGLFRPSLMLSKAQVGVMLAARLDAASDLQQLSAWAFELYLANARELEPGLKETLMDLWRMDDGPEFEFSPDELRQLAEELKK